MKFHLFFKFLFYLLVICLPRLSGSAANELEFDKGKFKLQWKYLPESQEIEFQLEVKTTGYVALGLTKINTGMEELDLFFGGFDRYSQRAYLEDRYSTSLSRPSSDTQQDYTLLSASEYRGITKLHCKRKLITNDDQDFQIKAGEKAYFAWATHPHDYLRYHTRRGYSSQMHVLVPLIVATNRPPTPSPTPSSPVNKLHFNNGNFNLTWGYLSESQEIELKVRARTTGYVAVGMTKTNFGMTDLDLFFAGITMYSRTTYLQDKHVNGYKAPLQDVKQDYTLISSSQTGGITTIHCKRKLITNDKKDIQIRAGDKVYFAYATHYRNDYLSYHTSRGYSSQMYEIVPPAAPTTTPPTTATIPSIVYDKEISFRHGDYRLFWKLVSSTNELFFKIKAKATGWVGLGLSNINHNMAEMDVVTAGVEDGQGYIGDYFSYRLEVPLKDSQQDYILLGATESDGITTVEFKRNIATGDNMDLQIEPGKAYFIGWAYQGFSDRLVYHSMRGYSEQKVVLVDLTEGASQKSSSFSSSSSSSSSKAASKEIPQYTSSSSSSSTASKEIPQYTSSSSSSSSTASKEIPQYTSLSSSSSSSSTASKEIPQYTSSSSSAAAVTASKEIPQYTSLSSSSSSSSKEIPQYTSSSSSSKEIPQYTSSSSSSSSSSTASKEIPQYTSSSSSSKEIPQYTSSSSSSSSTASKEIPQYTSSSSSTKEIPQYTSSSSSSSSSSTASKEIPQYTSSSSSSTASKEIPQYTSSSSSTTPAPSVKVQATPSSTKLTSTSATSQTPSLQETASASGTFTTTAKVSKIAPTSSSPSQSQATSSTSIAYDNHLTFNQGDFKFSWSYLSNTKEIVCRLEVKASGWVGLGFSDLNFWMRNMDVMMAGVREGTGYAGDYFSDGETMPTMDVEQDWTLISASEDGGVTTVEVKRKIDTDDGYDHMLMPGVPYYISWACHSTSDDIGYLGYHMACRGYSHRKVVLIPSGETEVPSLPMVTTVTETVTKTVTSTVIMPTKTTTVTVTVTMTQAT